MVVSRGMVYWYCDKCSDRGLASADGEAGVDAFQMRHSLFAVANIHGMLARLRVGNGKEPFVIMAVKQAAAIALADGLQTAD
jgi:hypothetical protein